MADSEQIQETITTKSIIDYMQNQTEKRIKLRYIGWVVVNPEKQHSLFFFAPPKTQEIYTLNNSLIYDYDIEKKPSGCMNEMMSYFGNIYEFELMENGKLKVHLK